ncbi:MAG: hypothetical protein HY708_00135 [Ignavibacteriae bacterium]|nr:hypothetical protein [Ignavibacteriota bacterium]
MKLRVLLLLSVFLIGWSGCKKDSTNPAGNTTTPLVTFTMSSQPGTQGGTSFLFAPSVDVRLTRAIVALAAQQFVDTLTNPNPTQVFSAGTPYQLQEYTGVASGQQWSFLLTGTLVSNNAAFNQPAAYTVP